MIIILNTLNAKERDKCKSIHSYSNRHVTLVEQKRFEDENFSMAYSQPILRVFGAEWYGLVLIMSFM